MAMIIFFLIIHCKIYKNHRFSSFADTKHQFSIGLPPPQKVLQNLTNKKYGLQLIYDHSFNFYSFYSLKKQKMITRIHRHVKKCHKHYLCGLGVVGLFLLALTLVVHQPGQSHADTA